MTEVSAGERPPPRFDAGTIVWVERAGQILLVRPPGSAYLLPPGGVLEGDEQPVDTARRELLEETGLEPDGDLHLLGAFRVRRGQQELINVSFACSCPIGEVVLSAEHEAYEWVDPNEYRELIAAVAPTITREDHRAIADNLLAELDAYLRFRGRAGRI